MRKFMITAASLVALAAPSAAMAAHTVTDGPYTVNDSALSGQDWLAGDSGGLADGQFKGSLVGEFTSRIIQNGQFVQDQIGEHGRSDVVQVVQALDGKGRTK